jgi:hypothetical protein
MNASSKNHKQIMKSQDNFDIDQLLSRIQKVEAPPFLLTRIEQALLNSPSNGISKWQLAAISFSFLFLLTANVFVIKEQIPRKHTNSIEMLSNSMNLINSNQLYND